MRVMQRFFLCELFVTEIAHLDRLQMLHCVNFTHGVFTPYSSSIESCSVRESFRISRNSSLSWSVVNPEFAKRAAIWNCLQWVRGLGRNNAFSL